MTDPGRRKRADHGQSPGCGLVEAGSDRWLECSVLSEVMCLVCGAPSQIFPNLFDETRIFLVEGGRFRREHNSGVIHSE